LDILGLQTGPAAFDFILLFSIVVVGHWYRDTITFQD